MEIVKVRVPFTKFGRLCTYIVARCWQLPVASTKAASGEQISPRRRKPKILAGALRQMYKVKGLKMGKGMQNSKKSSTCQSVVPKIESHSNDQRLEVIPPIPAISLSSHQCPRSHFRDTTNQLAPHSRQQHGPIHEDRTPICLAKHHTLS